MRRFHSACLSLAILAASPGAVRGQNTVSFLSTFAKPGKPVPAECLRQVERFKTVAENYPLPRAWKFVIACDDAQWRRFLEHAGIALDGRTHYGETYIDGGLTVLRGTTLLWPDASGASPEHVIAHELAHIALHSGDEDKVESLAQRWMAHPPEKPALTAAAETPKN